MPRYQLPRCPKGFRHPGAGWPKGKPRPVSVEARKLVSEMVNDPAYQLRLRADFRERKLHPTIEALVWAYHLGKPRQPVDVSGSVDVTARVEMARRLYTGLDPTELMALATESQAMVDRATAMAAARGIPQDVVVRPSLPKVSEETLGKVDGSDNTYFVNHSEEVDDDDLNSGNT